MKPTSLTPVTIPVEILALKNAKLPEKLLLGIYASNPKATRVRRAVSMTSAGLRKLKERLIQKKLLTIAGAHHIVQIPGFAYIGQPDEGHFVSDFSTTKNEEKVARPLSTTTPTDITPLLVPAELLDFKYLMASEKLVLACYIANPSATNKGVLATLGLSSSSLKELKQGLGKKNVLVPSDSGYVIRLPGLVLVRDSEGGHFLPESEAVENGNKVATPAPKLTPAADIYDAWVSFIKYLRRDPGRQFGELQSYTSKMIRCVENESPDSSEREGGYLDECRTVYGMIIDIKAEDLTIQLRWSDDDSPRPDTRDITHAQRMAEQRLLSCRKLLRAVIDEVRTRALFDRGFHRRIKGHESKYLLERFFADYVVQWLPRIIACTKRFNRLSRDLYKSGNLLLPVPDRRLTFRLRNVLAYPWWPKSRYLRWQTVIELVTGGFPEDWRLPPSWNISRSQQQAEVDRWVRFRTAQSRRG